MTIRLGTCSWTAKGWVGPFYPPGTKQPDYLAHYATRFDAVEIDATFYATPAASTVENWRERTPDGFSFTAKMPQLVTHEQFLENCGDIIDGFLDTMRLLGPKLGVILFQFPYFAKRTGVTDADFVTRLEPVLKSLPRDEIRFAVEVRNKHWLAPRLMDLLHAHGVALTLIDHPWMTPPAALAKRDLFTAPFTYIRWLGDRKGIERLTKTWGETVIDQRARLDEWVPIIESAATKEIEVNGFVNNHYGGHAPDDVDHLRERLGLKPRAPLKG